MRHLSRAALILIALFSLAACSREDREYFVNSGQGDWSGFNSYASPATTVQPRRCYQTSRGYQTCFN